MRMNFWKILFVRSFREKLKWKLNFPQQIYEISHASDSSFFCTIVRCKLCHRYARQYFQISLQISLPSIFLLPHWTFRNPILPYWPIYKNIFKKSQKEHSLKPEYNQSINRSVTKKFRSSKREAGQLTCDTR